MDRRSTTDEEIKERRKEQTRKASSKYKLENFILACIIYL